MKQPFLLKKTPADVYGLSILMILLSLLIAWTNLYNRPTGDLFVSVYLDNALIEQHSLYENKDITYMQDDYPFMLGDLSIQILDTRIRITQETSPLNICSKQGWVSQPGMPLICSPNSFMAVIEVAQ
jgi:hypothetical protein